MKNLYKKIVPLAIPLILGCFEAKEIQKNFFEFKPLVETIQEVKPKSNKKLEKFFEESEGYLTGDLLSSSRTGFANLIVNLHYGQYTFVEKVKNQDLSSDISYIYGEDPKLKSFYNFNEFLKSEDCDFFGKKQIKNFFREAIENKRFDATSRAYLMSISEDEEKLYNFLVHEFNAESSMLESLDRFQYQNQSKDETLKYLTKNYSNLRDNPVSKTMQILGHGEKEINNCFKIVCYKRLVDLKL